LSTHLLENLIDFMASAQTLETGFLIDYTQGCIELQC